ncbi:MAG TPA: metallophosphoesterase [Mycobacteriales bacterium]
MVAAGDIARPPGCSPCEQSATATLAQTFNPTSVFLLGDNQYDNGSLAEYTGSYALTWGRDFNSIVHPIPGNHEYGTPGAAGYLAYFGQAVANPDNTPNAYYSFNLGTWHIDALNSDCTDSGCSDPLPGTTTTAQTAWLQNDLAHDTSACTLAMWHHPLFSYGWTLGSPGVAPLWNALYQAHADIVLGGHDHLYERYAQQDPSGTATANGIREFVVGTGGESLNGLYGSSPPKTLLASDRDYGVLVLTLHASSYAWKFVNTGGATIDSGTTACHGPGAAPVGVVAIHRTSAAHAARLDGPELSFDARPIRASLKSVIRTGLAVAIHASRGVDVVVTASLRRGPRLQRIASFYETESQIPKPYSQILLRLPARSLQGMTAVRLVLRFAAVDSAKHRRTVTRTVSLR